MGSSQSFNWTWLTLLQDIRDLGALTEPRGQRTLELPQHTIVVDMRRPVLTFPPRKLSYKFMAAEAYWILSGDDRVETIAPYNPNIAQFSDDGKTFFGAYGPKISDQMEYVLDKLTSDPDTRQAGLTIWRESPPATKDVPCTVAMFFNRRQGKLNAHVFMRSSDAWLGVPYDVFNFSMVAHSICARLWQREVVVSPGKLYLTMASSHLYERNWDEARSCVLGVMANGWGDNQPETPPVLHEQISILLGTLYDAMRSKPGDKVRWWEERDAKAE